MATDQPKVARDIAQENGFDAVPVLVAGEFKSYWRRLEERVLPITKRHRVPHDASIEAVLPRLNAHLIQFVYFRTELVGLVDLSDLNKPLGRFTWYWSMAEVEQAILSKALRMGLAEKKVVSALGAAAKKAIARREAAKKKDLEVSLLAYAPFPDLLKTARALRIVEVSPGEIARLTSIRNHLAHAARNLVEKRDDGGDLLWALGACRRILKMSSM